MSEPFPQQPEQPISPESQAIQELDAAAARVFAENDAQPALPNPYDPKPEGSVTEQVTAAGHGDSLERTTMPDGSVTYKHIQLYYAGQDRGSREGSWQQGGSTMEKHVNSELYGISEPKAATVEQMSQVNQRLGEVFPANAGRSRAEQSPAAGKLRQKLGKMAFWR